MEDHELLNLKEEIAFGLWTIYYLALNKNDTKANYRRGMEFGWI